MTDLNKAKIIR